jgi:hypothetical protein
MWSKAKAGKTDRSPFLATRKAACILQSRAFAMADV